MKNKALKHFLTVCEHEFRYLVDEYHFKPAPLPSGVFINKFQYRLSNGILTLIVMGEGVSVFRQIVRNFEKGTGYCISPHGSPFASLRFSCLLLLHAPPVEMTSMRKPVKSLYPIYWRTLNFPSPSITCGSWTGSTSASRSGPGATSSSLITRSFSIAA